MKGGKVIASGGFGCVFKPALKCANSETRQENKISKLMTIKQANKEYRQIQDFKNSLQIIPNFSDYFLLEHFTLCKPDKLTKEDLIDYGKKCKALKKKKITSKNINKSLNKLYTLNMPYGGIDVERFVYHNFSISKLLRLNNSLIDLLVNGIIPMNKLNIFHCDIKDGNILVNLTDNKMYTRLIDWGISIKHTNNYGIPKNLYRRPFQYNVPFSSVLLNHEFLKMYDNFLKEYPVPDYYNIREFVINYIFYWNKIRGSGHLSAMNDIFKKFFAKELPEVDNNKIKDHLIEYEFTYYYIIEYISKILEKYTKNGKLELDTYFNNIFIKNIDIWGFVMVYLSLYEYLYNSIDKLNEYQLQFINKLKYIIVHFLYENPVELIDTNSLVIELTNLNSLIEKLNENHNPNKNIYNLSNKKHTSKQKITSKRKTRKIKHNSF